MYEYVRVRSSCFGSSSCRLPNDLIEIYVCHRIQFVYAILISYSMKWFDWRSETCNKLLILIFGVERSRFEDVAKVIRKMRYYVNVNNLATMPICTNRLHLTMKFSSHQEFMCVHVMVDGVWWRRTHWTFDIGKWRMLSDFPLRCTTKCAQNIQRHKLYLKIVLRLHATHTKIRMFQ